MQQPDELNLDLDIKTLMRACKGNVENLPTFMVHDDAVWPNWRKAMLDSKNRIHLRRTTFMQTVAMSLPVKAGLWLRVDTQQFYLDLKPHHLQGSAEGMSKAEGHKHSRELVRADADGQIPGDLEYGKNQTISERDGRERPTLADIEHARKRSEGRQSIPLIH